MILLPIVFTIRQPPNIVPNAIAACEIRMTQSGTSNFWRCPEATRSPVMIPIVFCASLPPWPRL